MHRRASNRFRTYLSLLLLSALVGTIATACASTSTHSATDKAAVTTSTPETAQPTAKATNSSNTATCTTTPRVDQIESELEAGETLIRDHACEVTLPRLGTVDFVPVEASDDSSLSLKWRDANGNYSPLYFSDTWRFWALDDVAFADINSDGLGPDIVAVAQFITGAGPTGAQPFPSPIVLLNDGNDNFDTDPDVEALMSSNSISTVDDVRSLFNSETAQASSDIAADKQCFRNEYGSGEAKDIEELTIDVKDTLATGQYNWIPAYKDRRLGEFEGELTGDIVDATYTFEQEGNQDSTPIAILVEEDSATIEGGDPALGLNATLSRVECSR